MQELGQVWGASPEFCVLHCEWSIVGQFYTFCLEEMGKVWTPNLKELSGGSVKIVNVHLKLALTCLLAFSVAYFRIQTFLQLFICLQHLVQSWRGSRTPHCWALVGHRLLSGLQKIYVAALQRASAGDLLKHCLWNELHKTDFTCACEIGYVQNGVEKAFFRKVERQSQPTRSENIWLGKLSVGQSGGVH